MPSRSSFSRGQRTSGPEIAACLTHSLSQGLYSWVFGGKECALELAIAGEGFLEEEEMEMDFEVP